MLSTKDVSERIYRFRKLQKRHSREWFAEVANISSGYVAAIEHGINTPTLKMLIRIANAYNISLDELLSEHPAPLPEFPDNAVCDKLRDCSAEEIMRVIQLVRAVSPLL